jgi:hypothetical protein
MTSLPFKKQICMGGGYMHDNFLLAFLMVLGGLFTLLMSFYILLCFIQWVSDVVEEERWYVWKEWFNYDN